MQPRGIPYAQIESNTELDSKLQRLARTLDGTLYYAAFGAYISIVLKAWATASRDSDPDLVAMIPEPTFNALVGVGLIDASGQLPEEVFERRVGSVLNERQKDADRKRAVRTSTDVPSIPEVSGGLQRTTVDVQPRPSESKVEERRVEERIDTTSLRSVAEVPSARSEVDWLTFVLDPKATPRNGSTGKPLNAASERLARIGDYWDAHLGSPFPSEGWARLAKLLKDHPQGVSGLLADIGAMAMADPKGDALDYLTRKIARRSNGTNRQPADPAATDYDAIVGARDARR